ncbi:phosphoenolpyruvate carboxykinase (ATP) [bacterium]|nr:MAG: phosphoenolpyruvate carboxykinase (ATP) [bacterium]
MDWKTRIAAIINNHTDLVADPPRKRMIAEAVERRECIVSIGGALATWTPPESTGRSPKDTVIVKRPVNENEIDWNSPNNIPITEETFDMAMEDALKLMAEKPRVYVTNKVVGADSRYALPIQTVSDFALTVLFTDNMFRPVPDDLERSIFADRPFSLVVLPYDKLDPRRYEGRLRKLPNGETSNMIVAMDFERGLGVIVGSAYGGSVKKLIFTVMNYLLPAEGILPLHCSANEGTDGNSALLLGLSGTGKTTLSADPRRALLGDDEHGWSDDGIANFENGCYAKLINLSPVKEPEIYNAVTHKDDYLSHGAIVENAMVYPDGTFDFDDERFTPNSRASYPLRYLSNIKESSIAGHPKTILFLTADANGVIPPVSKLNPEQAMLWFLMGYTSKLAGTETGIVEPVSTFSRFFGQPFMPRNPDVYARMLGEKMKEHDTQVYLINTGWSGGPYGVGKRMDIDLTRAMVDAALSGRLKNMEYEQDPIFKVFVPKSCPDVPNEILKPCNTWTDKDEYDKRAKKLAVDFKTHFDKAYSDKNIDPKVVAECPGM